MAGNIRKQILDGNVETIVLSSLRKEAAYGYQLIRNLFELTQGSLHLSEATVYTVLHRLEQSKFITAKWIKAENKRRRKYYRLTVKGEKKLAKNIEEWNEISKVMLKIIKSKKG